MIHGNITIKTYSGFIHYYIDSDYLGMFVFPKGEISDFRAIIRKNNIHVDNKNLYERLRFCLFELLNHYLYEEIFLDKKELQSKKTEIVKNNSTYLEKISEMIKENKGLNYDS